MVEVRRYPLQIHGISWDMSRISSWDKDLGGQGSIPGMSLWPLWKMKGYSWNVLNILDGHPTKILGINLCYIGLNQEYSGVYFAWCNRAHTLIGIFSLIPYYKKYKYFNCFIFINIIIFILLRGYYVNSSRDLPQTKKILNTQLNRALLGNASHLHFQKEAKAKLKISHIHQGQYYS